MHRTIAWIAALALVGMIGAAAAQDTLSLDAELDRVREAQREAEQLTIGGIGGSLQAFNPQISVILDMVYHANDTGDDIGHLLEEMRGFPHAHGDHDHGEIERGFNLREVELWLSADVDPYFHAFTTLSFTEHDVEVEEAVVQTRALPWNLQLQAGKFFSNFGRINVQHPHDWDFVDRPLVSELLFGDHGINEVGAQLTWLAPTPFYLLLGAEALQGDNESAFNHVGNYGLAEHAGPRLGIGWVKVAPNLPDPHALQLGASFGHGVHQEVHGGGARPFQGHSRFYGLDAVYKYDDPRPYGHGDFTVQAEYIFRHKKIKLKDHPDQPFLIGNHRVDRQDGLYAQAVYGFAPRWRGGLRWDQVGMTNRQRRETGDVWRHSSSHRLAAMVDFTPTEFSRLRMQAGRGEYKTDDGRKDAFELNLQLLISIGAHGAHEF